MKMVDLGTEVVTEIGGVFYVERKVLSHEPRMIRGPFHSRQEIEEFYLDMALQSEG